jgi:membrane dipeptidase
MNHGYDFHLIPSQEARAERLHKEAIIIDLLFQGPLSPAAIPEALSEELKTLCEPYRDEPRLYAGMSAKLIARWAAKGRIPAFREEWYASGITAGNRQVDPSTLDRLVVSMGEVERQFDAFDWLMKARTAEDIRRAKRDGLKAGIISAQETVGLGTDLDLLDALYDFGMRVLQLTYNTQNFVGSGCAEAHDGGVSNFGRRFIARMNELGMVVDTGHSGRQTTLDACRHSKAPVIASHTAAEALYPHMRAKSDDELRAIAETGGVIGVFAMPWFIHDNPAHTTMEHVLDHIDYVAEVAGIDHVGIGTDWPMSDVTWSLVFFKDRIAPKLGFDPGTGPSTETVLGFERYSAFINFTRGLVSRGYSDADILKILGGNWLRVFEALCG